MPGHVHKLKEKEHFVVHDLSSYAPLHTNIQRLRRYMRRIIWGQVTTKWLFIIYFLVASTMNLYCWPRKYWWRAFLLFFLSLAWLIPFSFARPRERKMKRKEKWRPVNRLGSTILWAFAIFYSYKSNSRRAWAMRNDFLNVSRSPLIATAPHCPSHTKRHTHN